MTTVQSSGAAPVSRLACFVLAVVVGLAAPTVPAVAQSGGSSDLVVEMPVIDPARGRALFISKGCVICHSVNGLGGRAAPPLEPDGPFATVDIGDFAARMWRGAGPMVWLQTLEMGYQIDLTGEDIAHLAGFLQDAREQARFAAAGLPDHISESLLTELYRRPEDWLWEPEAP